MGGFRILDSHTAPTLVEVTALGAAGHGTAVEGVSDKVEARPGERRKPLARHFAIRSRHAVSDASPTARRFGRRCPRLARGCDGTILPWVRLAG